LVIFSEKTTAYARRLRTAWVLALAITVSIGIYEIYTGTHFSYNEEDRLIGQFGQMAFASVFFGNFNNYSAYIAICFPLVIGAYLEAKALWHKAALLLLLFLAAFIVFVNTSRAATAFLVIAIVYSAYRAGSLRKLGYIALFVLLSLFMAVLIDAELARRALELHFIKFEATTGFDESSLERFLIAKAGIRAINETYGFGVGIGSLDNYMTSHYGD